MESRKVNVTHQDFEYISNDPQENADNFDPKWAKLRELNTDEERYRAIRERWGNSTIPDPKINLSHMGKIGVSVPASVEPKLATPRQSRSRVIVRTPGRSRSCTRPLEEIISNMQKNYNLEYNQLMFKQNAELQEMLQIQTLQSFGVYYGNLDSITLQMQQRQQVYVLLSNHFQEMRGFVKEKIEKFESCKRYMEEIKAFITFYQKLNDKEVTLRMGDEQYEHTAETEKMYALYDKFYK